MNVQLKDVMAYLEEMVPANLAESWDHVGLQVGNPEGAIHRILVALDVTEENTKWAVENNIDLLLTHHPFLFKPLKEVDLQTEKGRILARLISNGIATFAAHTNLDTVNGGVNDALVQALELEDCKGLVPVSTTCGEKIIIYMEKLPSISFEKEAKELFGKAIFYMYRMQYDFTDDARIELSVNQDRSRDILHLLKEKYEYKHIDIHSLNNHKTEKMMGRIGIWKKPKATQEALDFIKKRLKLPVVKICGPLSDYISKVAVLGGAGAEFARVAKNKGAELYITGDVKYHEAQEMNALRILTIDAGHFHTEHLVVKYWAKQLRESFAKKNWDLDVFEDTEARDVFTYFY